MGEKAVWYNANLKHFVDICKEEIDAGCRPNGCFTRNGWKNLAEKFFVRSGLKLVKTQLKNKLDIMKKDFTLFMDLKNLATRLGWDETKQTIACSNTWWTEHLAVSEVLFMSSFNFSCLYICPYLHIVFFQRCNNPEKGVKCGHVKF
jgi:hypothetical protein